MSLKFIDVSSNNGISAVKDNITNIDGAIVKLTQGTNYVNPYAVTQFNDAFNGGKENAIYHYVDGSGGAGAMGEVNFFWANLQKFGWSKSWGSPLVLDWESGSNSVYSNKQYIVDFANNLAKVSGVRPIVYCGAYEVANLGGLFSTTGFWVAGYPNSNVSWNNTQSYPYPWPNGATMVGWQYTSTPLDISDFYLTKQQFAAYGGNGLATAPATSTHPTQTVTFSAGDSVTVVKATATTYAKNGGKIPTAVLGSKYNVVGIDPTPGSYSTQQLAIRVDNTPTGIKWLYGQDLALNGHSTVKQDTSFNVNDLVYFKVTAQSYEGGGALPIEVKGYGQYKVTKTKGYDPTKNGGVVSYSNQAVQVTAQPTNVAAVPTPIDITKWIYAQDIGIAHRG